MHSIAIKINPGKLENPDLDIRYKLPNLLEERSGGMMTDNGYDYAEGDLVVFLNASDIERAIACISDVIASVRVLNNDLHDAVVVAVQRGDKYEVVYPPDSREEFGVSP